MSTRLCLFVYVFVFVGGWLCLWGRGLGAGVSDIYWELPKQTWANRMQLIIKHFGEKGQRNLRVFPLEEIEIIFV